MEDTPVVMVVGPRQSGKSTLVRGTEGPSRRYVSLDDPDILGQAKRNPKEFLETYRAPLILDEVQRAPELFLPLKLWVDRDRTPGSYLLTGSANVLTLPKVADSLAGRIEVIDLLPLHQAELEDTGLNFVDEVFAEPMPDRGRWGGNDLADRIGRGGYPEHAQRPAGRRRTQWCESYIRTLLERDVRDLANIEGLAQLPRLLALLAARNGSTLNVSSLSRDTGIAPTTLTRYLDLLKALYLLQLVPAWSSEADLRLMKTPKAYLVDTGLACHLANLGAEGMDRDRDRMAPMLEGFVANELARQIAVSEGRPWLMHLRTVRNKEVDFVLESRDRRIVGIEVRPSRTVGAADAEGLRYLAELAEERFHAGIVLYDGSEAIPLAPHMVALPVSALWSRPA